MAKRLSSAMTIREIVPLTLRPSRSLLGLALCLGATAGFGENQRTFTVNGTPTLLENVSTEVQVLFRAMRFNEATERWNVDVTITNSGGTMIVGPVFLSIESFRNTTGPVNPDGLNAEPPLPFYEMAPASRGAIFPGETLGPRTLDLGFAPNAPPPAVTTAIFAGGPAIAAQMALGLTRTLDAFGLPLPDAQVTETFLGSRRAFATDPSYGVATLGGEEARHVWKFEAPGRLPVWRQQTLLSGGVQLVPNPRLVPRSTNYVEFALGVGGVIEDTGGQVRVTLPANGASQTAAAALTLVDGQTLPAFLPQGWSPLQVFWLEYDGVAPPPWTAVLRLTDALQAGDTAALARWDEAYTLWRTVAAIPPEGTDVVNVALPGPGAYAVVVGDAEPLAPPPPAPGVALPASAAARPAADLLSASGVVSPPTSPASPVAGDVTATATVMFQTQDVSLPSGLAWPCDIAETYRMQDGSRRFTPPYENDVVGYQRPGDANLNTLHARFPLRPRLLFGADELADARVTVEVLSLKSFTGGVFETTNSEVASGEIAVVADAGDFSRRQAAVIRHLDGSEFQSLVNATGMSIAAAFDLTVSLVESGHTLGLSVSNLPPGGDFVLARVLSDTEHNGLEPLERLYSETNGALVGREPATGDRLPGLRGAGQYVLVQVPGPLGLVLGHARTSESEPASGLPVRIAGQPWLTLSGSDGRYLLAAPSGAVQVVVTDAAGGVADYVDATVADPNTPTTADLTTAPHGPRVASVTPATGSRNVSRVAPVLVTFTQPVNAGTVVGSGLQLLDTNGVAAPASLALNLKQTVATLLPTDPLAPASVFTLTLAPTIADLDGQVLEGPNTFTFTTESDALNREGGQLVIYEPGATNVPAEILSQLVGYDPAQNPGLVVASGSPGTADPESPVILVNEDSGETSTVLSKPDGRFAGFVAAGEKDFVSAVLVNANGTRLTIPATRQLFDDGSVGLYHGGGILEAQGDDGPVQIFVEPGAIATRTVFTVTPLSLQALLGSLPNPPTNAQVIGGMHIKVRGDEIQGGTDISFAMDPGRIPLPEGAPPEDGAYALTMVRDLEDGGVAFQVVDKLRYQDGKLISNTQPFKGFGEAFADAIAENPTGVLGLLFNPVESLMEATMSIVVLGTRPVTVTGRVALCPALTEGGCVDELLDPFLQGFEELLPTPLQGVGGAIIQQNRKPLSGAFVSLSLPETAGAQAGRPGRLTPGLAYATSDSQGKYALVLPYANQGYMINCTHPRYQDAHSEPLIPFHDYELGQGAIMKNFTFQVPLPGNVAPRVSISHTPLFPATNEAAQVVVDIVHQAPLIVQPIAVDAVLPAGSGAPGEVTISNRTTEIVSPTQTRLKADVSAAKALTARLKVRVALNTTSDAAPVNAFHNIEFGAYPPAAANQAIQSDPSDRMPPQLERTVPLAGGLLPFGASLELVFNEPIDAGIANQASQFTLGQASAEIPAIGLSADQTRLFVHFGNLKTDRDYELTVDADIRDLAGNEFVPPPSAAGSDTFTLKFRTLPVVTTALPDVTQGGGVAVHGNYAYVLDREGNGRLRVYDISNPSQPVMVSDAVTFIGTPRDLVVLPAWPHVRRLNGAPQTNDLLAVVGGHLGSLSLDEANNVFIQGQYLRVYDLSDPANPSRILGALITQRPNAIAKIRWQAPKLAFLEIGSDLQQVGLIDLQEMLVGFNATAEEAAAFHLFGVRGVDAERDGDYVDAEDRVPEPPKTPNEFFGRDRSFLPLATNGTRPWLDFDYQHRDEYCGVVYRDGVALDSQGRPTSIRLPPGYRTLALGEDITAPTAEVTFGFGAYPKRVFALLYENVGTPTTPDYRHLALVSLSPDSDGVSRLAVIDITVPTAPVLTNKIEFAAGLNLGSLQSVTRRPDGLLGLATSGDTVLLDPSRLLAPTNGAVHVSFAGVIPGAGSGNITLGGNAAGVNVVALGARNQIVQAPPAMFFVRVLRGEMTDPEELADDPELRREVLAAMDVTGHIGPARFRAVGGAVSTLDPANPTNHYHVLMYAPGGAGDTISLGLQALNRAGYPLRSKGRDFAPVRAVSEATSTALKQSVRDGCDAPIEVLKAYRLSDQVDDPEYNVYLSEPFALTYEKITAVEINTLTEAPARRILWSAYYLEAFIDPEMDINPVLGPFAARVTGADSGQDLILQPRASVVAETFPATYIPGPNPPPATGGEAVPGTFGLIGANNGEFRHETTDLALPGRRMPIVFERAIGGQDLYESAFGRGWDWMYGQRVTPLRPDVIGRDHRLPQIIRASTNESVVAEMGDLLWLNGEGRIVLYKNAGSNAPPEVADDPLVTQYRWDETARTFYLPSTNEPGVFDPIFEFEDGHFARLTPGGEQFWYDRGGRLMTMYDRYTNNFHKLIYNARGELARIVDGAIADDRRFLEIGYYRLAQDDERRTDLDVITEQAFVAGKIARLKDYAGRVVDFEYTDDGILKKKLGVAGSSANQGDGGRPEVTYVVEDDCAGGMQGLVAGGNASQTDSALFTASFDGDGKVAGGGNGAGGNVNITAPTQNTAAEADGSTTRSTGPDGAKVDFTFEGRGYPAQITYSVSGGETATVQPAYNALGLLERVDYPLGNAVVYTYDVTNASLRSRANLLRVERIPGPRGGPTLTNSTPTYDGRYNLPEGEHLNFNGKTIGYTLLADGRDIDTIAYQNAGTRDFDYNDYGQIEKETTPEGLVTDPAYNDDGFISTLTRGPVPAITYLYDATPAAKLGLPTTVILPRGAPIHAEYDDRLLLLKLTRGAYTELRGYDRNGNLKHLDRTVSATAHRVEDRVYNRVNFLEKVILKSVEVDGVDEDLEFDFHSTAQDAWRIRAIAFPGGQEKRFDYDDLGNVTRMTLGTYVEDYKRDAEGNLLELRQGGTLTRANQYDGHDRLTNIVKYVSANVQELTALTYFGEAELAGTVVRDPDDGIVYDMQVETIDGLGRTTRSRAKASDAGNDAVRDFHYAVTPGGGGSLAVAGPIDTTTITHDGAGRTIGMIDALADVALTPNGNGSVEEAVSKEGAGGQAIYNTHFTYNDLDYRATHGDDVGTIFTFTPRLDGAVEKRIDGANHAVDQEHTVLGERTSLSRANGVKFAYAYDRNRQPRHVGDPAEGFEHIYDSGTFRITQKDLRSGDSFTYEQPNALNLPESGALPGGTATYGYDLQGRLTKLHVTYAPGEAYRYDNDPDAMGRIRTMAYGKEGQHSATFAYDKLGPLTEATYRENLGAFTVSATLHADGSRATVTYPTDGPALTEERDAAGRLLAVKQSGVDLYRVTAYKSASERAAVSLGGGAIAETMEYDRRRRLLSRRYEGAGGALLADVRYQYDPADNRTARQEVHRHGRTDAFAYDAGNRLTRADIGLRPQIEDAARYNAGDLPALLGLSSGFYARTNQYDAGNLDLLVAVTNINPDALLLPPLPPFATSMGGHDAMLLATVVDGIARPGADPLGNAPATVLYVRPPGAVEPQPVTAALTYNGVSHLVRVAYTLGDDDIVVDYECQPNGLMHYRKVTRNGAVESERALIYDNGRLIEEHEKDGGATALRARYYYADEDAPFAADLADSTGQLERVYYLRDAQSSVIGVADATGSVRERVRYDPWGQPVIERRDEAAPRISAIFASVNNELLVQFTELVMPPLSGGGPGSEFVTDTVGLDGAFEVIGGSGLVPQDPPIYEEDLPSGFPFGAVVRVRPVGLAGVQTNVFVRVLAGALVDEWGNPNPEQTLLVSLGTNTTLYAGPAPGSTAPQRVARSAVGSPFLFHGQYFDYDTGLLYLRARFYDPFTGTFLQQDPSGYDDSVNLYAGFGHNPTSLRDPTGAATRRRRPPRSTGSGPIHSETRPKRPPRSPKSSIEVDPSLGSTPGLRRPSRTDQRPDRVQINEIDEHTSPGRPRHRRDPDSTQDDFEVLTEPGRSPVKPASEGGGHDSFDEPTVEVDPRALAQDMESRHYQGQLRLASPEVIDHADHRVVVVITPDGPRAFYQRSGRGNLGKAPKPGDPDAGDWAPVEGFTAIWMIKPDAGRVAGQHDRDVGTWLKCQPIGASSRSLGWREAQAWIEGHGVPRYPGLDSLLK
jgi:RHS repeat-associated protein